MKFNVQCQIFSFIAFIAISISGELTRVESNFVENLPAQRPDMQINPVSAYPNQGTDLWNAFYLLDALPSGVTNLKAEFPTHWAGAQVGTYKYIPPIGGVKMKNGIVLSSGNAADAIGPNDDISKSGNGGFPGDADLNNAAGYATNDASVLMLTFRTDATVEGFTFTFSFGTEEFPGYVGTEFNDPFLVLLDGKNICKDSYGNMITVNSMFFDIDNTEDNGTPVNLQWNGFTYVLKCSAPLTPGDHVLKFAVCDATDYRLDSGVFLSDFKFEFDNTIMIPEVNIIDDQEFTIAPTQVSDFLIGEIENLSNWGPVSINEISNTAELHLDGWNILTSNPTDLKLNDEITIKVAAKLDTTFAGQPWIVHDTATMTIKVAGNPPWPDIKAATIFDKDGNGIADSVAVEFEYAFPDVYTLNTAKFSWPENTINYNESINNSDLETSSILTFAFTPDAGATIHTDGNSSIQIMIDSLDNTTSHSSALNDGIGPLLVDATVVKRYKPDPDTFTINLTESVNTNNISGKSFILIKGNHVKEIEISPLGSVSDLGDNKKLKFLISDLGNDAPTEGDSLQILSSGSVRDIPGNSAHPDNTPVPINFSNGSLEDFPGFENATIYDKNGNGIGDSIVVNLTANIPMGYKFNTADFVWPQNQFNYSLNIDEGMFVNNKTLPLEFVPDGSADIHTFGSSTISLSIDSLGKNIEKATTLTDGIGPLLVDATVIERYNPGEDSFTINLTEPVNVNSISGLSFILIKKDHVKEIEIEPIASVIDLGGQTELQFNIADLGTDAPAEGDSLKILSSGPVKDLPGNSAHKYNTPVPIQFDDGSLKTFPNIKVATIFDNNGNGIGDSIVIELSENLPNAYILKESDFTWPKDQFSYNKQLTNGIMTSNKHIPFSFAPDPSSPIQTNGESMLTLTVDSLLTDVMREATISDGIGPLLVDATVIEKYDPGVDSFTINLTEPVNVNSISGLSFILIKKDHAKEIEIAPIASVIDLGGQTELQFNIADLGTDAPAEGDSLKILSSGPVKDLPGNSAHKDNTPVPIQFDDGSLKTFPNIKVATIFDKNGNGIGDSIVIELVENLPNAYVLKESYFTWPKDQFSYNKQLTNDIMPSKKLIPFSFTPDPSSPIQTNGESILTLTVDSLLTDVTRDATIADGIGPILTGASVVKRYSPGVDTLRVNVSESVIPENIIGFSFIIIKENNAKEIEIFPLEAVKSSNNETSLLFTISDLDNDAPAPGDSLKILSSGSVTDIFNNKAHIDNPAVPFEFLDGSVPVEKASYYDSDGNGIVDMVVAKFVDTLSDLSNLKFSVLWDNGAKSNRVDGIFINGSKNTVEINIDGAFQNTTNLLDKTSGNMDLNIYDIKTDVERSYPVNDSAAPVIIKAVYYPLTFQNGDNRGSNDSLRVIFSEPINDFDSEIPFWLEDNSGSDYFLNLKKRSINSNSSSFTIASISKNGFPMAGDSIWINSEEGVGDQNGTIQRVFNNKRVILEIVTPPFILKPIVYSKKNGWIPQQLLLNNQVKKGSAILLKPNIFVPEDILSEIEYSGKIFDATGNLVTTFSTNESSKNLIECGVSTNNTPNGIVILWSRKNLEHRNTGSSMYVGYIQITYPENIETEEKLVIPVQSDY